MMMMLVVVLWVAGEPNAIVIDNGLQGAATRTRCLLHKKPDFTKKGFQVTLHEPQISHIESAEGR